jgi:uncharacterized protein (DUF2384 family)
MENAKYEKRKGYIGRLGLTDEEIYKWNRKLKSMDNINKSNLFTALFTHGKKIFGSKKQFGVWLKKKNFYFDNKPPGTFMHKPDGIKFIDDRLTSIEYGDNA